LSLEPWSYLVIIDVFQDTVCPWCRIGEKHLNEAIKQWTGDPVTVRHHPFELQPQMPAEGRDFAQHMAAIKGDTNIQPMFDRVCQAGEACEVNFRFDRVQKSPNTLLSHVLMAAVPEEKQSALLDVIHQAYFEDGRDIGDRETLLDIATELGLDRGEIAAKLDDPNLRQQVSDEASWARGQGITGVPFFVFDNAVALSGAQPVDTMLAAMRRASAGVPMPR
jgi:predicted DsbA family dithiol-disulfide isomerase